MRLIDADKLRKDVLDLPNCYNGFSDTYDKALIIDLVDEQPTVDAVEVVRCKDCKHSYDAIGGTFCSYGTCVDCIVDADFFCKNGER